MKIRSEHRQDVLSFLRQWCAGHGTPEEWTELEAFAAEVSRTVGQAVMEQGLSAEADQAGYEGRPGGL